MSILVELLSSRVRAEVFRQLFGIHAAELHGRDLARGAGANEASLRHELRRLTRLGLVRSRRQGNRVYYSAAVDHPLYPEVHGLVLKTSGLVEVVAETLGPDGVDVAFVFGSVAQDTTTADSDVDLMVIGSLSLRELTRRLQGLAERLGREVNPHVLTQKAYADRLERGDHFVTHVLSGRKVFVIGSEDALAAVGGARMAES